MSGLIHAPANQTQVALQTLNLGTATASGTGVDVSDYEGQLAYTAVAPVITGTPTSVIFSLEHSDTSGSGYVAVTGINGSTVASPAWTVGAIGNIYRAIVDRAALKRFVRSTMTLVGGSSPTVGGTGLLLGAKKVQ